VSGQALLALAIALFLLAFLVVPVATVVYVAFTEKGTGAPTLVNFLDFARTDLFLPALDVAELVLAARGQCTSAIEALRREALASNPQGPATREPRRPSAVPRQRGVRR
jgi:ABC-type uncharacterized transport system permease subunit